MESLESVWTHGGEPFLYFDYLEQIIKAAKKLEIPKKGVITNSFFAKTEKLAKKKLEGLKEAGLTSITFSCDSFHQEFIPIEYVKNALISAVEIGFDSIFVDTYFIESITVENQFNKITIKNLDKLGEIETVDYHRLTMSVEGCGTELTQYIKSKTNLPSGKCPVPFWIEGDLENPKTIEIDSEGNVTLCPGICIGNINNISLTEIVQNYDVEKHLILSVVWKEGPIGLLQVAKKQGFQINQNFVNECHLCYEVRKFLQPFYPIFLAPKYCY